MSGAYPRIWTLCGYRAADETTWRPTNGFQPQQVLADEQMGRCRTEPRIEGAVVKLMVRAR